MVVFLCCSVPFYLLPLSPFAVFIYDQALLGFTRNLTHLDGHVVPLVRKGVTQPGFVQTIKGKGMPLFERPTSYGDLFVEYNVVLPTHLSKETRQSASDLLSHRPNMLMLLAQPSQVLPRRFMGSRIEIVEMNYRLIRDYFIPCIMGLLRHSGALNYVQERTDRSRQSAEN